MKQRALRKVLRVSLVLAPLYRIRKVAVSQSSQDKRCETPKQLHITNHNRNIMIRNIHLLVHTQTYIHTCVHTYMHTYIYIYIHTQVYPQQGKHPKQFSGWLFQYLTQRGKVIIHDMQRAGMPQTQTVHPSEKMHILRFLFGGKNLSAIECAQID